MNNHAIFGILAIILLMICGASVPNAVAHNGDLSGIADIHTSVLNIIHGGEEGGKDVADNTVIEKDSTDEHDYHIVPNQVDGYPASTISVEEKADASIVEKNSSFDMEVIIQPGLYYCLKVEASSRGATNEIYIESDDYATTTGNPYHISPGGWIIGGETITKYYGVTNGKLVESNDISDGIWIYADHVTSLHIYGDRKATIGQNWGSLVVNVIMKPTPDYVATP